MCADVYNQVGRYMPVLYIMVHVFWAPGCLRIAGVVKGFDPAQPRQKAGVSSQFCAFSMVGMPVADGIGQYDFRAQLADFADNGQLVLAIVQKKPSAICRLWR
jgi:hypothetical protein